MSWLYFDLIGQVLLNWSRVILGELYTLHRLLNEHWLALLVVQLTNHLLTRIDVLDLIIDNKINGLPSHARASFRPSVLQDSLPAVGYARDKSVHHFGDLVTNVFGNGLGALFWRENWAAWVLGRCFFIELLLLLLIWFITRWS